MAESHRVGGGKRKSFGGGPLGVADHGELVENSIAAGSRLKLALLCMDADTSLLRASAVNGLVRAMFKGYVVR